MTEHYQPPKISNELGRSMTEAAADRNSFARGEHGDALCEIDGQSVPELAEKFGSPLFVFSEARIRKKARRFREAFKSRYPKTEFAWSYKTNYLNAICRIFHQEGWLAEVVSDFEYQKARALGVAGKDIIVNGPYQPRTMLEQEIAENALIQIDNWDQLSTVEEAVKDREAPLDVGIRIWLDAGIRPVWSKFGFALENGEAERAAVRVLKNQHLRLHTLHTHIGTYILAPDAYRTAAAKLVALRDRLDADYGHLVECLNLGGGFPSYSLLHGMTGSAEQVIEPIETYADAVTGVLRKLPERKRPLLRLEAGRHLIDEAGFLVTTIVALKGMNRPVAVSDLSGRDYKELLILGEDAKAGYVVDAGVNLLYTAAWYQIGAVPARQASGQPVPSRLYGSLCMAIDVIRDHVNLPPLETGDILTLHPVGAYNVTQSMQFISYLPAVVLIATDGTPEIIRARDDLSGMNRLEHLPKRLTGDP